MPGRVAAMEGGPVWRGCRSLRTGTLGQDDSGWEGWADGEGREGWGGRWFMRQVAERNNRLVFFLGWCTEASDTTYFSDSVGEVDESDHLECGE